MKKHEKKFGCKKLCWLLPFALIAGAYYYYKSKK